MTEADELFAAAERAACTCDDSVLSEKSCAYLVRVPYIEDRVVSCLGTRRLVCRLEREFFTEVYF